MSAYFGRNPTATEVESGEAIEEARRGPIKPGKAEHLVLRTYGRYEEPGRMTSYYASWCTVGDWHSKRRESTRLLERGFLVKDGTLPNRAPAGRPHVDAYRITDAGRAELARLEGLA